MITWTKNRKYEDQYKAVFEIPNVNEDTFFYNGLFLYNKETLNFLETPVLAIWIAPETCSESDDGRGSVLEIEITLLKLVGNREIHQIPLKTVCAWDGKEGWLYLGREQFPLPVKRMREYRFLSKVSITGNTPFQIKEIGFQKAEGLSLSVEPHTICRTAQPGETITWNAEIKNEGKKGQLAVIRYADSGWNELVPADNENKPFETACFFLNAGERKCFTISVLMTDKLAPGGYEKLTLQLYPDGQQTGMQELTVWAGREMEHPCGVFTKELLDEIRNKVNIYSWARISYQKAYEQAVSWRVPVIDVSKDYLFETAQAHHARDCAIIYQLSREERFAEKTAAFLREWSHPLKGYLRLPRAGNQELVHDGEFFKSAATAYDLTYNWKGWTCQDRENIERAMRFYMQYINIEIQSGEASNWLLAEIAGAVYCAAVLGDRERLERFLYGSGGAADQLARGVFDDGWWFEASIGYNLMCAGLMSEISLAAKSCGIDFAHIKVSPAYRQTNCVDTAKFDGLVNDAWGPARKNYRSIDMLWDSLIPFYDYRGVIMGINDSSEQKSNAMTTAFYKLDYELAYKLFGKPEYAYMVSKLRDDERNVLFGEGKRPEFMLKEGELPCERSCRAENAGLIVLRSHKEGRPIREQIQVGVKYGSHGGAHGHYDRGSMTGLMRYGRSLTNPENVWYCYHTFMYKFYCQTSVNHNMVTVDLKQQEAADPKSLLFYSGKMIQAFAGENNCRWSYPPYGGWPVGTQKTMEERQRTEGRFFPIPASHPEYAKRSGFTEPVLTRRVTAVTDDYVVNFDFAKSKEPHRFQCLYHLQGLRGMAGDLEWQKHTEQLDDDPLGSAQFITDCDVYRKKGTACLHFKTEYNEYWNNTWRSDWKWQSRTAYNEFGELYTDLYFIQPEESADTFRVACPPEFALVNKRVSWQVIGDGEILEEGAFGAWILGKEKVSAKLTGRNQLVLQIYAENGVQGDLNIYESLKTVFWGNPVIKTKDGRSIDLKDLEYETVNTDPGYGPGKDYEGCRVTIQAEEFDKAIPAEPADRTKPGRICIDLEKLREKGIDPVSFEAVIGGDYPVGDESRKRRTLAEEQEGREARFITLIEPHEKEAMVVSVRQTEQWGIEVKLRDGRTQKLQLIGMEGSEEIEVRIREIAEDGSIREERGIRK